ncbi:MAG: LysM peptidoglycan-binding domain-containing protein [Burkholderiaceae bacterium]
MTLATLAALPAGSAQAATSNALAVSPSQQNTAQRAANEGLPLSELAVNAPDSYTVKRGDTLWAISKMFLKSPWRWPELWGMNMAEIKNPHLIYPGQTLYLDKSNGRARLRSQSVENGRGGRGAGDLETVKLSPRTRVTALGDLSIPTLQNHLIEPFLSEPIIVEELTLELAPRLVATQEGRVLLSEGDRAYARSASGTALTTAPDSPRSFRIFRNATALKDPGTSEVLGYEAQYIGRARLIRPESVMAVRGAEVKAGETAKTEIVPATFDIVRSKEEIRTGDRLLPEPPLEILSYSPHAPAGAVEARIVSVYGSTVANVAQNQIVVINRGTKDGMERGHVLAIQTNGARLVDKTGPNWQDIKLPDERNGLLMVFRPFEKLSYALVLQASEPLKVGDWLINPR